MKKIFILGSINMDIVVSSDHLPNRGETMIGNDYFTNPGGKGANQAVACAKMNSEVYLASCVGNDGFGNELINTLNTYRVKTDYVKKLDNFSTGSAIILIVDNDNRIIITPNANAQVSKEDVNRLLNKAESQDIFLTQLEIPLDVVEYGLKRAKEKGLKTILNPAPANNTILGFLSNVDILIPNETELALLSGIENDIQSACRSLASKYQIETIIVTLGSKGHALYQNGQYTLFPCMKVNPVDTTAAGDTFCGILASFLANDCDLVEAMHYASIGATLSVMKKGAQQSIPYRKDIEKMIK